MLTIFHAPGTRSIRVIWACEELGAPYRVEAIPFTREFRTSPAWLARNPVGKVPAMDVDGEFTMFESGAMVQYVLDRFGGGRLQPVPGTADAARYLQWCWFAEATMCRPLGDIMQHTFVRPEAERLPAVAADGRLRAAQCLAAVDTALADREWLVGDFSGADIMMGYALILCERAGLLDARSPHARAYFARLQARPAYKVATA